MSNYYVTTPIYYVNGAPHIGHAYTTILADALARYKRLSGEEVFFLTGTDEHGLKVQRAAEGEGIRPKELADKNSAKFRELFDRMELTYDRFIRTTDEDHRRTVETIVAKMIANGDVYLDTYEGWYSASDEAFYDESEIADGIAIASGSSVEWVKEESYFFKLSNYQEALLSWYTQNPSAIAPKARNNEVTSFVESGLRDLSITRTTFDWGIPWPEDPKHVLYVWVDALTNYITAVGAFQDDKRFHAFWPADVHLIGKDILRFHAVYWPAFLMSANLPLPKQIFAHGWWTNDGAKMSKSKGNFIDAFDLVESYDLDVLRYYMLREIPPGNDGDFSYARVVERNNAELADNIGNLVNRALTMTDRFIGGKVPTPCLATTEKIDVALKTSALEAREQVDASVNKLELHRALETITSLSSEVNNYIQTVQPWALNKEGNQVRLAEVLYNALEAIRFVSVLISPFIPDAASKILDGLGIPKESALRTLPSLQSWGALQEGLAIEKPDVLFKKLEAPVEPEEKESPKAPVEVEKKKLMGFQDFMQFEIKVAKLVAAEKIEGADKLLKITADLGEESPRTIVAGIAHSFAPEDLLGLRVAVVANLQPAKLFGIRSEAMILATPNEDGKHVLATYPETVPVGSRIA